MLTPLLALGLGLHLVVAAPDEPSPFVDLDFETACTRAKTEGKVVMVDFSTRWCPPCRDLDRITWRNDEVRRWLATKTFALKIDAEESKALAEHFEVKAYPTLLFVRPDGTVLGRLVGYRGPAAFLESAEQTLQGNPPKEPVEGEDARERKLDPDHDPMVRSMMADELARQGKLAEALEQYVWCWDHALEWDPAYSAVRHSFVVGKFAGLALRYPPAMVALRERRERAASIVRSPEGTWDDARDVGAIDEALGELAKTLALYDEIRARERRDQDVRRGLFTCVMPLLIEAKRYDDFLESIDDIPRRVRISVEPFDGGDNDILLSFADGLLRKHHLDEGGMYYEALLGTGQMKDAEEVSRMLLGYDGKPDTFLRLARHAWRAGNKDIAEELIERGLTSAPDSEQRSYIVKEWRRYLEGGQSWWPWR
jgi:thiol-disulfide isomerase/thioredoxin